MTKGKRCSVYFECAKSECRVSFRQCSYRSESELFPGCAGCEDWITRLSPGQLHVCTKCSKMEFAPFPRKCRKCGNEFDQLELEIIEGVPVEDSQEAEEASA